MAKTRIASAVKAPKSDVEIKRDIAIKEHAKHPERIEEIERIAREFQKQEENGEISDRFTALAQFESRIERVGARAPLPPKSPKPKTSLISKGTWMRHSVAGSSKAQNVVRKGKKSAPKGRQPSKRVYVK
jgi:hypothetical protein